MKSRFSNLMFALVVLAFFSGCSKNDSSPSAGPAAGGIVISSFVTTGNTALSKAAGGTIRVSCNWTATEAPVTVSGTLAQASIPPKTLAVSIGTSQNLSGSFTGDFTYSVTDLGPLAPGAYSFAFWLTINGSNSASQTVSVTLIP